MSLSDAVQKYQDFPKPAVVFQDMSKILADPKLLSQLVDAMADTVIKTGIKPTKIAGVDARGFIYGPLLAYKLGCGFVMIRKKGKLPGSTSSVSYGTEYSKDTIEVLDGIIDSNDLVLVVDDLVATGGSLEAASKLIKGQGGTVVGYLCPLRVDPLYEQAQKRLSDAPLMIVLP